MQPSQLEEDPVPIQQDIQSLDGSTQRNFIGLKYQVKMSFINLTISGYQQLIGMMTTGSGVTYYNDLSAEKANGILTFSGVASFTKYPYVAGSSLYQQLDVLVRQY